ncbi:MAG TPA: MMPL family transporter [Methylomirabilota bacterium]|nr:MMPL family transporter [Methylomirabilota bacterium]
MSPTARVGGGVAWAVRVSIRRPMVTLALSLALAAVALAYTVHAIGFVTSSLRLLPQRAPYVVTLREYLKDFGELNDILVAVEAPTPDEGRQYVARLASTLGQTDLAGRVSYRIDPTYFRQRGLLYLSMSELVALRDRLYDYQDFLESYAARPSLDELLNATNRQIAAAMVGGFFDLGLEQREAGDLRFLEALLTQMGARLNGSSAYVSPWASAFSVARFDDPDAGYYFSRNKKLLFLFVSPRREEGNFADNREWIEALRAAVARLGPEFPRVQAGVTGSPALSNDEMVAALADGTRATMLALVLTLGLLLVAFRQVVKPLLMLACLAVSLAWSMGVITLTVGHLSIFSVMFISIVVGIGIDYGIYLLFRYEEERRRGGSVDDVLDRTARRTGPGLVLGALTAAGAFLVLVLIRFQGIREFGLVSGIAIFLAFVAMITLFPALLALIDRRARAAVPGPRSLGSPPPARWLERIVSHQRVVLGVALACSALAAWGAAAVAFDANLLKLQAKGVESVRWEERVLAEAGSSGVAAFASARTLTELRAKLELFEHLPSVARVDSILMLYPSQQEQKIKVIRGLSEPLAGLQSALPPRLDPQAVRAALDTLRRRLGLAVEAAEERADTTRAHAILGEIDRVLAQLRTTPAANVAMLLGGLQDALHRDFTDKLASFRRNLRPTPVAPGDAPPELRHRYVGKSGRYLIRIQPAVDIWQQAGAERFVSELRSVDPDVTGPPVTSFEAIRLIRRGYYEGAVYALALVAIVTVTILRSFRATLLALTPLLLSVLWTLGCMKLFDLSFTMANVWAVPLIIGIAAEFGLNIYVRFIEGQETGGPTLPQSGVAGVLLNGLTTIAGFASLMVARHQGIFGLGLLLTIGAGVSLVGALVVLPVLIRMFGADRSGAQASDFRFPC